MLVAAASLAFIPLGILISAMRDPMLRRRSRFWLRVGGLVTCMALPWMVGPFAAVGEQAAGALLWIGTVWMLLLIAFVPLLLFRRGGSEPGPPDDGGGGLGPEHDGPPPHRPIGGIPLPDAEQPSSRVRGSHPSRRGVRPRRATAHTH
jgi:hypothetical protein